MALAHSTRINELQVLRDELSSVSQIEQAFAQVDADSLSVLLVLAEYDAKTEKKIIEIEGQIIDAFPWLDIDFDIVYLSGRSVSDVVSPKGFQLIAR